MKFKFESEDSEQLRILECIKKIIVSIIKPILAKGVELLEFVTMSTSPIWNTVGLKNRVW